MRKKLFLSASILAICMSCVYFISCASDEPSPEEVDDTLKNEMYFVSGRVSHKQLPLDGVLVKVDGVEQQATTTADGNYQLFLKKKGDYSVRFQKDDFIEIATIVRFDEQAPNRSSIIVSPEMTKRNPGIEVNPDDEIEITDPSGRAVLRLMRSIAEKTDVSLTLFNELPALYSTSNSLKAEPSGVAYATVFIEPKGMELTKASTLLMNKQTSDAMAFSLMDLYERQPDNSWKKLTGVTFDKSRNAYTCEVMNFSSYSLRIPYLIENVSEVTTTHLNSKIEIDNCGNMRAKKGIEIQVKQRCGWEFVSDVPTEIRTIFPAISEKDVDALSVVINDEITSLLNESEGYYDLPVVLSTVDVSGNSTFLYENYAKQTTQTYVLNITYKGTPYRLPVVIKRYSGMEEKYSETSCYQHSGGQGQ